MKRFFSFMLLIVWSLQLIYALEWPVDVPVFLRAFGQNTPNGVFEQGLVFSQPPVVRAADSGKILIGIEKKYASRNFPSTLGNAVIMLHDDGLQTVYANLDGIDRIRERRNAEMGSVIGKTGTSGWGTPESLHFQVIDTQKKAYINPLLILPAFDDEIKPQIKQVLITTMDNIVIELDGKKKVRKGSYELYAAITDQTEPNSSLLNPFRISILVNGVNIRSIPFETITLHDRKAHLGNTAFYDQLLYQKPEIMYLGKIILNRGTSKIAITARDITGNEHSKLFVLQVD